MFDILHHVPLLENLEEGKLRALAPLFEPFHAADGATIFEQGGHTTHLHILVAGGVELRYKPYDGPPMTLSRLAPGAVFGWSAAIGNPAYTSSAIACGDCDTVRIRTSDLHRLYEREPQLAAALLDRLAGDVAPRWKNASQQVRELLGQKIAR
ncbi:MAG: cyclic nucleotide-binding domain-containing protein [Chloroflexota bacterium]